MRTIKRTAIAVGVAQLVLMASGAVQAQTVPASNTAGDAPTVVVVTGQRKALENAQSIKQNAEEVVDSIVADEAGKLPDRSIAEVLQRVVGVTIDRVGNKGDPQHFSVEGTGVTVRGLSYVRSELNGRDAFSANGGRALSWADVPPELMAGVDVYKNPSAEQIEGGLAGLINLRTALPFDFKGQHGAISVKETRGTLRGATAPDASGLYSNRWETGIGQVGALIDLAHSENKTRSDGIQAAPYFPRTDMGPKTLWVPQNGAYRREDYDHTRDGVYGALQWKNKDWSSSLTYFQSKHKSKWVEAAQWSDNDPYKSVFSDATYDDAGIFKSGTISNPQNGGVQFYNNTKVMTQTADTKDLSWNLQWQANDHLTFKSDFQLVRAKSYSQTASIDLGEKLPSMGLDVRGSTPQITFDDAARAAAEDPANNYWNSMSWGVSKNDATQKTWRGDAQYTFDDPVLKDVRFGLRLTDRDATNRNASNWAGITPAWAAGNSWQPISSVATLADPRFAQPITPVQFTNFFNGKAAVPPSMLVPTPAAMDNFAPAYALVDKFGEALCNPGVDLKNCHFGYQPYSDASFNDPTTTNKQSEQTTAAYSTLRFGFDNWEVPVDGNIGVRVVQTRMKAQGYMKLTVPTGTVPPGVPPMSAQAEARDFSQRYVNVLPSLNLKASPAKDLQFRFAFSQGVARPDFAQLQAYEELSQGAQTDSVSNPGGGSTQILKGVTYSGSSRGNPLLKPTHSTNFDLTAEWYPARATSVTVAVFSKNLRDIIVNQTYLKALKDDAGVDHNFVITGPTNGAKGSVQGVELGAQTYFDKLPGLLSGIGVSANYTYIDSKYKLYNQITGTYCSNKAPDDATNFDALMNGCDTDGRSIGNLPMPYLSKNAFNLALMYDKGPISARLAYSWRSRYLQAVNANGYRGGNGTNGDPSSPGYLTDHTIGYSLPVWAEGYGTVDGSISYKFDDHLSFAFEGQNLTNTVFKQTVQQHVGTQGIMWFATGPRYTLSARYTF